MAEKTLSLSFDDYESEIGYFLGYGRTSGSWDTEQQANITFCMKTAQRTLYFNAQLPGMPPHRWRFMYPTTTLTTTASYSTGTIAISSGVVTGTGTTFPTNSADGELEVSGNTYTIASYSSGTSITLDDTSVNVSAGASFLISFPKVSLPADFGGIVGNFTYDPSTTLYSPIEIVNEAQLRELRQSSALVTTGTSTRPVKAAIIPVNSTDATDGQRFQAFFWPSPGAEYRLTYRYLAYQDALASDAFPLGGQVMAEPLMACCLYIAERHIRDIENGPKKSIYYDMLAQAIAHDNSAYRAEHLGEMKDNSDRSDDVRRLHLGGQYVTYSGNQISGL